MDQRLVRLLRRQAASGFEDLRGAEAAVTLPVSDKLLNEISPRRCLPPRR